jgi:hypothetical protein
MVDKYEFQVRFDPHSRSFGHGTDDCPRFCAVLKYGINLQNQYRRNSVLAHLLNECCSASIGAGRKKKAILVYGKVCHIRRLFHHLRIHFGSPSELFKRYQTKNCEPEAIATNAQELTEKLHQECHFCMGRAIACSEHNQSIVKWERFLV